MAEVEIKVENLVYAKPRLITDTVMHYCPGCSHGTVHKLIAEVIDEMGLEDKAVGISPVGCAVFAYNYIDVDWVEAAHGRACAVATAVKRLHPNNMVFTYQGDGDLTEVKAGFGWEIFKGFSVGIAAKYYWGYINHNYTTSIYGDYVGSGDFVSANGNDEYAISNFKFQAGLQWNIVANNKRMITLGATYDYGGPLRPKVTQTAYIGDLTQTVVAQEDSRGQMRLPHAVNAGITYQDAKIVTSFDYEYQNWGGANAFYKQDAYSGMSIGYVDTHTYKFGFEYTPNRFDARNYFNRVAYRIGARYGDYYQSFGGAKLNQYAVTAGFAFPLRFMGATTINAGIEFGGRGNLSSVVLPEQNTRIGLIRQRYIKVHLGFSLFGEDYWFVRPKID